jgi:hypothetical protein
MSDLPILDPDWRPSTDDEALEAADLLKDAFARLQEYVEERLPWRAFLKEHPELEGSTWRDREGVPHFYFRDRDTSYEAILAALRDLASTKPKGVTSWDICQHLWGADARRKESNPIGQRLHNMTKLDTKRLERYRAPHAVRKVSKGHYLPLESGDHA